MNLKVNKKKRNWLAAILRTEFITHYVGNRDELYIHDTNPKVNTSHCIRRVTVSVMNTVHKIVNNEEAQKRKMEKRNKSFQIIERVVLSV